MRELHPFTTITHLASKNSTTSAEEDDFSIQFLFRKSGKAATPNEDHPRPLSFRQRICRSKKQRMQSTQWTGRLAGLADNCTSYAQAAVPSASKLELGCTSHSHGIDVALRLEGPYFSPADPSRYDTVVCLVAGTGISGAIAIAAAFNTLQLGREPPTKENGDRSNRGLRWRRCVIVWNVKEQDDIDLPLVQPMAEGFELRKFLTGPGRSRADLVSELEDIIHGGGRTWVYISGPSGFIDAGKIACEAVRHSADVEYYAASWDV